MAHGKMTTSALYPAGVAVDILGIDGLCDGRMAAPACGFDDLAVEAGDLNRVRIISGGEIKRVKETVARLHRILADNIVRGMAVVAGSHGMMAGFHPATGLLIHYMAVGAGAGVVEKIRISARIKESIAAEPDKSADQTQQNKL